MDSKEANVQRFNEIAASWDEEPQRVQMAEAIAAAMIRALQPDQGWMALEIGCGTGLITLKFAAHVERVMALDSSREMLARLRAKCQQGRVTNIDCREGSVTDELPSGPFDVIFSSMVLHHVENIPRLFRSLYLRLRPGGYVALADLDIEDGSFHSDPTGVVHHGFKRETFGNWLTEAGLVDVQFSTAHRVRRTDEAGSVREYQIFLAIAQKRATRP